MTFPMTRSTDGVLRMTLGSLAIVGLFLFGAAPAAATCDECTPARPAADELWGEVEPVDSNPLPSVRDSTLYNGNQFPGANLPLWEDLDIEGGRVYTVYSSGFQVWDVSENPASPQQIGYLDGWEGGFLDWTGSGENVEILRGLDVPNGRGDLAAIGGKAFGVSLLRTDTNPANPNDAEPQAIYQHTGYTAKSLYSSTIGGNVYAFASADEGGPLVYNMSAADELTSPCLETVDGGGTQCPGVFVTRMSSDRVGYVHGVDEFLVSSSGGLPLGVRLWDVSTPSNPDLIVEDLTNEPVMGVALWREGGAYYLAARLYESAKIFDVTTCLTEGCAGFRQNELWTKDLPFLASIQEATFSRSNGRPIIHFGMHTFGSGSHFDYLYDVSDPSNPREIIPRNPDGSPKSMTVDGFDIDYWSWYYYRNPTGFSHFAPKVAKFSGDYLYRAARTLFDVHRWNGPSGPTIEVDGPSQGWQGDLLEFTATPNSACAAAANGWSWNTDGGDLVSGGGTSAVTIRWATGTTIPEAKTVTATNSGCPRAAVQGAVVDIQSPTPTIGSVEATPQTAPVCTPIRLEAFDVEGKPTISTAWDVTADSSEDSVASNTSTAWTWVTKGGATTPAAAPGSYTASFTADNGIPPSATKTVGITLQSLDDLPAAGFPVGKEPHDAATVPFHVDIAGATEWNWDFGVGYTGWTDDPISGPNPVHTYTESEVDAACPDINNDGSGDLPCTFEVRVKVRNCLDPTEVESTILEVLIEELTPLIAEFAYVPAGAFGVEINYKAGEEVPFDDLSTGAETYDYDWHGDGFNGGPDDELGRTTPAPSHVYDEPGDYHPVLRVNRGGQSDVYNDHPTITIDPAEPVDPPSISLSKSPRSADVGTPVTFTATGRNCDPDPPPADQGWNWTATGVTVTADNRSVSITWSSDGFKSVQATHPACGSARGSTSVEITSDDGGGNPPPGGLDPQFTFDPAEPEAGQEVTFDASGSGGAPDSYEWTFHDGTTKNGVTTTFTFQEPGSFEVTLKLVEEDPSCAFGFCTEELTQSVTVAGGPTLRADFDTSAECTRVGLDFCSAETGQEVSFIATEEGADVYTWDFGDGTPTVTGRRANYTWKIPATYDVTLTVQKGGESASFSREFRVDGEPLPEVSSVVLPWIAQADPDKILQQESDLYVHNPGPGPAKLRVTFRRQGLPEADPPSVERTLAEHATLYFADVMTELFNRPNVKGFLIVEPLEGEAQPVVTSFNRTFREDRTYGQVIPGFPRGDSAAERQGGADVFHLVGLNDNSERLAYFGITNPTDSRFRYHLRFYDAVGREIASTSEPLAVSRYGFKQFQVENIHNQFGVQSQDDYRVAIEPVESAGTPIPFGANLRLGSRDPSFLRAGRTDADEVFVVGALDTQGLNDSVFQSDLVLTNTSDEMINVDVTFTGAGFFTEPTEAIQEPLPPGSTTRLVDVISEWDEVGGVGVLRLTSDSPSGIHPLVQGESYEVSNPDEIYGQFMPALTRDDAAVPGQPVSLVGLRQDADFLAGTRSTVWLYNPEDRPASYRLRYFDHSGRELGTDEQRLPRGKLRQVNPGHHLLPEGGAPEGFVLRVEVESGALLVAGQVVNDFNDPAYLVGR